MSFAEKDLVTIMSQPTCLQKWSNIIKCTLINKSIVVSQKLQDLCVLKILVSILLVKGRPDQDYQLARLLTTSKSAYRTLIAPINRKPRNFRSSWMVVQTVKTNVSSSERVLTKASAKVRNISKRKCILKVVERIKIG